MSEKANLILIVILGLFLAAVVSQIQALALMAVPFLFYLGAGLLTSPGKIQLTVSRSLAQTRSEANKPIAMLVTIENQGTPIPRLRIADLIPPNIRVIDGRAEEWVTLPAGEKIELAYTFEAPRGQYVWETTQVTASDPFGLFERKLDLQAEGRLRVLPDTFLLNGANVRPRQTLRAAGLNLSRRPGSGFDFWGVREYHPGDPMRWVHWRLSARHPGMFFTKEFEREEMADICLLLDGSLAANLKYGAEDLFEYSVQATAALAKWFLRRGDRVSLLVLGDRVAPVFPDSGKRQLVRIMDNLAASAPGKASLNTLKYLPVRLFPSHSLIIAVSPLRANDFSALARLRSEGYQVLLISPNPVEFARKKSPYPLAVRAARLERMALLMRVLEMGVDAIDWQVDRPLMDALRSARRERGRGLWE